MEKMPETVCFLFKVTKEADWILVVCYSCVVLRVVSVMEMRHTLMHLLTFQAEGGSAASALLEAHNETVCW